jgi:hypothetical protein
LKRYFIPILLMGLPFALAPLLALGEMGGAIFACALMAHVVGADWILLRPLPAEIRGVALVALKLAIGIPTALFAIGMVMMMVTLNDDGWMVLPFVLLPALAVWPFVIISLFQPSSGVVDR